MAVTAQTIVDRAQKTLFDETEIRWTETELLDYLNAGIKAIVTVKPDAYVTTANTSLTINSSKQEIPTTGIQLLDITRIVGGDALRQIERKHLDRADPSWHATVGTPKHFMHDPRNPRIFYVYPVPAVATQVELVYADTPADIIISAAIPIDDIYENPLHNWVMAYAYFKNTKRGDMNKGVAYLNLFNAAIGSKSQVQFPFSPPVPDNTTGGA